MLRSAAARREIDPGRVGLVGYSLGAFLGLKVASQERSVRAVEVLERIATPEARQLLAELARGDPAARRTGEAAASLRRLERRSP